MTANRLTVSLRETRVMTERLLLLLGVPKGAVPAVREMIVDAEALGLGGLAFLDSAQAAATSWRAPALTAASGGRVTVEAHGMPAPYAAPALLDLGVALQREHGRAEIEVGGVRSAHLLLVLPHAALPYGAGVDVTCGDGAPRLTVGERAPAADPVPRHLARAVRRGLEVDAALWWRLYHRSNDALTEDTPVSRRHAGATLDPDDQNADVDYVGANP
ncbi:hypothetical protein [Nonomuraea sp. B1E8]|uniref:hypothetical protein n=1 Tax=unclassified Nonomuraea TaxID=2593643 RepID=UPI00325E061B